MGRVIETLKNGGIVVLPTDTIYGIVGQALNPETVSKIYALKERPKEKPFIVLISKIDDLKKFSVGINSFQREFLEKVWPGKVSVILPTTATNLNYLTRGCKTLAFRFPDKEDLVQLINETGPLVAPSANLAGHMPAKDINRALEYFDGDVDIYIDGGFIDDQPSTLVELGKKDYKILRQGSTQIR